MTGPRSTTDSLEVSLLKDRTLVTRALGRCFIALAAVAVAAISTAQFGRNWALVIGVESFESEDVASVPFAVADARSVADSLIRSGYPAEQVVLMTSDVTSGGLRPSNVHVIEQIDRLAQRIQPEDSFLLYYVGHGITREGRHFLATVNTRMSTVNTLELTTLSVEALTASLKNIQAQRAVYIFDAFKGLPEKARAQQDNLLTSSFNQALMNIARSTALGNAGVGVLIANSINERSYEAPVRNHSVFAWYVVDAMTAAFSQGEPINFAAFAAYVQASVRTWSDENLTVRNRTQTPQFQLVGSPRITFGVSAGGTARPTFPTDPIRPPVTQRDVSRVSFETIPAGARISVDGVQIGGRVTPFEFDLELEGDEVRDITIVAELEGYQTAVERMTIRRGQPATILIPLRRIGDAPAPTVETPFLGRQVNVGDTYVFAYRSESRAEGTRIEFTATDTQRVTRVAPDGNYTIESTVTNGRIRLNNQEVPQPDQPPTSITYGPNGDIVLIQSPVGGQSAYRFANMSIFVAPGRQVGRGDRWEYTISADAQRGVVPAVATYQVERTERVHGIETFRIRYTYRETTGASPASASGVFNISAVDGWLVRAELTLRNAPSDGIVGPLDITLRIDRQG